MTHAEISAKLAEINLTLPEAPKALAVYVPAVEVGGLVYVSGQLPMVSGQLPLTGIVGGEVTLEQAQALARQCAVNAIAALGLALNGDFSRFERVIKVEAFVASTPAFTSQHLVANGFSEVIGQVFGEQGIHARAAVGVPCLPLNAPVEVAMLVKVKA